VRLCPETLRREYGAAIEETIAKRLVAARAVGRWGAAKVWCIRLIRGRTIGRSDVDRREPIVVVDLALAAMYFPGQDPIGKRVRSATRADPKLPTPPWLEIVGVVSNTPVGVRRRCRRCTCRCR
jgi:hypothetical protein